MTIKLQAILARTRYGQVQAQAQIDGYLHDFAAEFQHEMATYPPAQPWKNPPKTGLRAGGRRTGNYGRGWNGSAKYSKTDVTFINPVGYAKWVGGKEQARSMARRGWKKVTDVAPLVAKRTLPKWKKLVI